MMDLDIARIIGGVGTSHVPTIGVAYHKGRPQDPAWALLYDGYKPVARWLAENKPDVLLLFYNDRATTFFFDLYPTFALGIGTRFPVANEGRGRAISLTSGATSISRVISASRWSTSNSASRPSRTSRSSTASPRRCLCCGSMCRTGPALSGRLPSTSCSIPLPTGRRCYQLGQAVRRAIETYPEDLSVVIDWSG